MSGEKSAQRGLYAIMIVTGIISLPINFFTGVHSAKWLLEYTPAYDAFPFAWTVALTLALVHICVKIALEMNSTKLKQYTVDMMLYVVDIACVIFVLYPYSDSEMFQGFIIGTVIALEFFFWVSLARTIQWAYIGRRNSTNTK